MFWSGNSTPAGGGPGVFVSDLGIFPNPDNTATTVFEIHGDGFSVGNVVSIEIKRNGVSEFGPFQVAQLTVDEFTIKYVHSSDISTLLAGNYSAFVVTTEGDFETPSFFFEPVPGGGSGPQIFGGGFFEEGGVTQVEIFWSQIPNDLTSVTVGRHVVSGPTVSPDTQSPNPEDIIIKGAVSALISTITPGLFDVNITSTLLGPLSFPQLSF